MDKRQRLAMQQAMAHEAIGKLHAIGALYGVEDGAVSGDGHEYERWAEKVAEFESWLWGSSPLA